MNATFLNQLYRDFGENYKYVIISSETFLCV
jgi:hypothetical protein